MTRTNIIKLIFDRGISKTQTSGKEISMSFCCLDCCTIFRIFRLSRKSAIAFERKAVSSWDMILIGGINHVALSMQGIALLFVKRCNGNERPLDKREIKAVVRDSGISDAGIRNFRMTYKYVDNSLSFIILPVYNLIEGLTNFRPLRNRTGFFLITHAKK